jgi:hypothetical protein
MPFPFLVDCKFLVARLVAIGCLTVGPHAGCLRPLEESLSE